MIKVRIIFLFLSLLIFNHLSAADDIRTNETENILLLTSYHQGDIWTDSVVRGITDVLSKDVSIEIYTEHMDFRRRPDLASSGLLDRYILKKYKNEKIDLIIVSDDAALDLMIKLRPEYFPDIPMVFCGINDFKKESIQGQTGIVGVNEALMIDSTLDLALKLLPKTKQIYGIATDLTMVGRRNLEEYRKSTYQTSNRVELIELLNITTEDAPAVLSNLPENSVLLDLSGINSPEGRQISRIQTMELMASSSNLPVFTLWTSSLGKGGALGGVVVDGYEQGQKAGDLASRILNGEDPESMLLVTASPNITMLDYIQLKHFKLTQRKLPPESVIINKPSTFYQLYKKYIWLFSFLACFLIMLILMLLILYLNKRKTAHVLALQERKFRTFFEHVPDYVLVLEQRHDDVYIADLNEAACSFHGYKREELLNKPLAYLDKNLFQLGSILADLGQKEEIERNHYEVVHMRKDGSTFPVETTVKKVEVNGVNFLFSIERDLTKQKAVEYERNELEKQLRQKHKMEAIGVLTGGIAHNFNNSLNIIIGNFELAALKNTNPQIKQFLNNGIDAAFKASDLIKQLMSFSHSNEKKFSLIDLSGEVEKSLSLFSSTIPSSIQVITNIKSECRDKYILADSYSIHEVLLNLCNNATQAMGEKGTLTVSLEIVSKTLTGNGMSALKLSDECFRLSVTDTGCGMSEEIMERIFDPFFTTKDVGTGTGIGLSTVKGIVEQLGGSVKVQSRPGAGSTFELYFSIEESAQKIQKSSEISSPGGKERILLVDDDALIADTISTMLKSAGYEVATADSGLNAYEMILNENNHYDLLITDQTMPQMTGKELIERVRKTELNIPAILLSGNINNISREEISSLRLNTVLSKPCDMKTLLKTVREVLDGSFTA